ncbi:hypothetical protein [Rhizobium paknamense]|uniref:Regulator of replication initiation timing n=1 Tax=Rhizobium paknamense TaxID=1206817 RepID=A0ABU0ICU4_9HYPH|nr:hypothetical protein [Rhizobium paknamense]MDQ0456062.1 regulator of replication initiation timing [Rhizobium paknamense]
MEAKKSVSNVIWWCCFLECGDKIYESISEIGLIIKKYGHQLVVIGSPGDYTRYAGFEHIAVSVSLVAQGQELVEIPGASSLPMTLTSLPELLETESFWTGAKPTFETEFNILKAARFWEKSFEIMQPSVIIVWGSTAPFSRLLLRIANLTQTPSYVAERGLTENTLMLNLLGQCIVSNIGTKLSFIQSKVSEKEVAKEWEIIKNYYKNTKERNYKKSQANLGAALIAEKASGGGPKVLFLGAFDLGSGLAFRDKALGGRFARAHLSSQEAAQAVASALSSNHPGAMLINKAHPASPYDLANDHENINILNVKDADFRELIEASDVIVTPISTTQVYGFIYEKPVVTLSNSFFTGRNITYDVTEDYSLGTALNDAINHVDWEKKFRRARSLIVNLFRDEFVGLTDDVPCRLKVADLARHLALFKEYRPYQSEDAKRRLQSYRLLESFAKGRPDNWSAGRIKSLLGADCWNSIASEIVTEANHALEAELHGRIGLKQIGGDLAANIEGRFNEILADTAHALEARLQSTIGLKRVDGDLAANIEEAVREAIGESRRSLEAELESRIGLKHAGHDLVTSIADAVSDRIADSNRILETELQSRIGFRQFGGGLAADIEENFHQFLRESHRKLESELQNRIGLDQVDGDLVSRIETKFKRTVEDLILKSEEELKSAHREIEKLTQDIQKSVEKEKDYQRLIEEMRQRIKTAAEENAITQDILHQEIESLKAQIELIEGIVQETQNAHMALEKAHADAKASAEIVATWVVSYTRKRHGTSYIGAWGLKKNSEVVWEINPVKYLIANPDVAEAGVDPLDHWQRHGKHEGRSRGTES